MESGGTTRHTFHLESMKRERLMDLTQEQASGAVLARLPPRGLTSVARPAILFHNKNFGAV